MNKKFNFVLFLSCSCLGLIILIVTTAFHSNKAWATAASIKAFKENNFVAVALKDVEYDQGMVDKKLDSAIPIVILGEAQLMVGNLAIKTIKFKLSMIYDLWDEDYRFELMVDGKVVENERIKKREDALFKFKNFNVTKIAAITDLVAGKKYQIIITLKQNLVKRDDISKLKKVVLDNTASVTNSTEVTGGSRPGDKKVVSTSTRNGPRFKKIFNKILDQYLNDKDEISQWEKSFTTLEFGASELVVGY
ncbi:MAG: hypothetical protein HQK49_06385 [Oligoflexia bacterium]|nr:hypothetical protein [Oligoflexia bacterium]